MRDLRKIQGWIIGLAFLLLAPALPAQEGKVYVSNNPDGPGISVRWAGSEISYQEGIKVYRRQGRKDWELLTPSPIMPPTTIPSDPRLTSNDKGVFQAFLDMDHQEFVDGFAGILTLMESLKRYPLALALRIAYDDESAEKGKKYTYKVEATLKGSPLLLGESEEIRCEDFTQLPAPENITFKRKRRNAFLWWDNDPLHYFAYNVYVKKGAEGEYVLHTPEIGSQFLLDKKDKFIDLRTHKDTAYFFKVEALDYFGGKSVMSEEVEIKVQDFDPPSEPEVLVKSSSKDGKMTITWKRPPEEDLVGYDIYRKQEDVDTVYTKLNRKQLSPEDTLFMDQVEDPGAYTYQLHAFDEAGNVARSFPETGEVADIIPPPVPQYFDVMPDTGKFVMRWQSVKAKDLKGYIVMRSLADEDNSDNIWMPASEIVDTNYFAEPMAENVRAPFVYRVHSVDSLLNRSEPSKEVVGQLPDVNPPVAPMIKSVDEEDNALRIVWAENREKDLKGYHIYKRQQGDTTDYQRLNGLMVPKDISAYTDKEAERGQSYEYYVLAVDYADLVSPKSNIAKGKIGNLPLSGELEIVKQKFNPVKSEFNLVWNGGKLENEPVVGYSVHCAKDGGRALQRGQVSKKMQFKEKLSEPGMYEYHIRVYGKRGNILYSDPIQIKVEDE